jgi:hypothetical protein
MGFLIAAKQLCNRYCSKKQQEPRSRALRMLGKGLLESNPTWVGSRSPMGWWFGLAPSHLEFGVRFPNERNQRKQAHPVLKYRVPHGSHSPLANSFAIGTVVIDNNNTFIRSTITTGQKDGLMGGLITSFNHDIYRTGAFGCAKTFQGPSPEPPTL